MALSEGKEGLVGRHPDFLYPTVKCRPNTIVKIKPFETEEYKIIDAKQGEGQHAGLIIFLVSDLKDSTKQFWVTPAWKHEERKEAWLHFTDYIGELLTVRFREKDAYNLPFEPVGLNIRSLEDYDEF